MTQAGLADEARRRNMRRVRELLRDVEQVENGLRDAAARAAALAGKLQHARDGIAGMLPEDEEAEDGGGSGQLDGEVVRDVGGERGRR